MLLCRVIHPLGAQWLWVLSPMSSALLDHVATVLACLQETRVIKHVDNLVHAGARKGAPLLFHECVDGCGALSEGPVVAARQTAAVRYALFIVWTCAREGVVVSAIGFFVKLRLKVVKCLTGREREGVDAVMPRNPPAWRSIAKGAVTSVRCLAGLWVGDLWSSKHVPYSEVLLGCR